MGQAIGLVDEEKVVGLEVAGETGAKQTVHNDIGLRLSGQCIAGQMLEQHPGTLGQTQVVGCMAFVGLPGLGVENADICAVVVQVACDHKGVSAVVAGAGQDQNAMSRRWTVAFPQRGQGLAPGILHEDFAANTDAFDGGAVP